MVFRDSSLVLLQDTGLDFVVGKIFISGNEFTILEDIIQIIFDEEPAIEGLNLGGKSYTIRQMPEMRKSHSNDRLKPLKNPEIEDIYNKWKKAISLANSLHPDDEPQN